MNKARIEALSDGVFAIVMTLLIFDVKVPATTGPVSDLELWRMIFNLWPLLISYALSFFVLSVIWINHHFLFHTFAKEVNRQLNLMNMIYLMLVAFVPFLAHLFGSFPYHQPAVVVYGLNILAVVAMGLWMNIYIQGHETLGNDVSKRMITQGRIRNTLTIVSYALGIVASFISPSLSLALYLFPLIFNIIPGSLNLAERTLGLEF